VSTDADIDRLRESIRQGTEMLQGVPVQGRILPRADTIFVRDTVVRPPPDTGRRNPPDTVRSAPRAPRDLFRSPLR
jgi:hypothetical protein